MSAEGPPPKDTDMPTKTSYTETVYVDGVGDVPRHLAEGLLAHALTGFPVAGFLTAVLSNDLVAALAKAKDLTLADLTRLGTMLYNNLPQECWGSTEAVLAWKASGGLEGIHEDAPLPPCLNALRLACEKVTL